MGWWGPQNGGFLQFQKPDNPKWPQLRFSCTLVNTKCQHLILLASHVVINSKLVVCQVPPEPFKHHPSTQNVRQARARGLSKSRLSNALQYYTDVLLAVGLLMSLLNGAKRVS